jgi:type I restriction enzyme R subunit
MQAFLADDTQLYKQYSDNEGFRRWLTDMIFAQTFSRREDDPAA